MSEYILKEFIDTSDADATAADILSGKTGYVNGEKVIGTKPKTTITRWVTNDTSITPTGSYTNGSYYNSTYGVKIGYMSNGDILLSMKAGTSSNYEKLHFVLASAPSGVTLERGSPANANVGGSTALIYACVLKGIAQNVTISIDMSSIMPDYDYVQCDITVTAA